MLYVEYSFINRQPSPMGKGYQYDVVWQNTARGTEEALTTILPFHKGGKRSWIIAGRIGWGIFKTRWACADEAVKRLVLDPETEALDLKHPIRTRYNIRGIQQNVAEDIYRILKDVAGAIDRKHEEDYFVRTLMSEPHGEYRFGGWISHGKLFWDTHSIWVAGAPEQMGAMERNMVARTNAQIQGLLGLNFPTI